MSTISNFEIGDIVTLKSHPLFRPHAKIKEFSSQVPPLMLVKEVHFENKKNIKNFSEEMPETQISDNIKYVCVFFNASKSQFEEKMIYRSFLKPYLDLKYINRVDENKDENKKIDLIPEVATYKQAIYKYGMAVQFKTKKLEHRKSYDVNNNEKTINISFQTPDFILSGTKKEAQIDLFYSDGSSRKIITEQLYKVIWYNHMQQKFSEHFLPKEFFVTGLEI